MWHSRYSDQHMGWTIRVRFPAGEISIFLLQISIPTLPPSAFYSLNIRVKKPKREPNYYPVCSAKVKDKWNFLKFTCITKLFCRRYQSLSRLCRRILQVVSRLQQFFWWLQTVAVGGVAHTHNFVSAIFLRGTSLSTHIFCFKNC